MDAVDFDGDGEMDADCPVNCLYIVKYDADGQLIWLRTTASSTTEVRLLDLHLGPSGDAYVTGTIIADGMKEVTIDFDADERADVSGLAAGRHAFVARYYDQGRAAWVRTMSAVDAPLSSIQGQVIGSDPHGNVYVAGTLEGNSTDSGFDIDGMPGAEIESGATVGTDGYLVKFDAGGAFLRARLFHSDDDIGVGGIAVDDSGTAHLVGGYVSPIDFDGDDAPDVANRLSYTVSYMARFDTNTRFLGASTVEAHLRDVAIDSEDNSYVVGSGMAGGDLDGDGEGEISRYDSYPLLTASYDPNGDLSWFHAAGGGGQHEGIRVALDETGAPYVAGHFRGDLDLDRDGTPELSSGMFNIAWRSFFLRYAADGTAAWLRSPQGETQQRGVDIALGPDGQAYVLGSYEDDKLDVDGDGTTDIEGGGNGNMFLVRYDDVTPVSRMDAPTAGTRDFLSAPAPNPVSGRTVFGIEADRPQKVRVTLVDMLGRHLSTLFIGEVSRDQVEQVTLEASDLPSGIYFIRAKGQFFQDTQRIVVL